MALHGRYEGYPAEETGCLTDASLVNSLVLSTYHQHNTQPHTQLHDSLSQDHHANFPIKLLKDGDDDGDDDDDDGGGGGDNCDEDEEEEENGGEEGGKDGCMRGYTGGDEEVKGGLNNITLDDIQQVC